MTRERRLIRLVRKARTELDEVTRELLFGEGAALDHAEAEHELEEAKARVEALQARVQAIMGGGGQT
jgi:hypothetical protein